MSVLSCNNQDVQTSATKVLIRMLILVLRCLLIQGIMLNIDADVNNHKIRIFLTSTGIHTNIHVLNVNVTTNRNQCWYWY